MTVDAKLKRTLKDSWWVVKKAIEGGLFDDLRPRKWPDLDWRNCDRWEFVEGKRRADSLIAGTGVEFYVPNGRADRAEHWRLRVRLDGPRYLWLQTQRHSSKCYVVDGCTGRRA